MAKEGKLSPKAKGHRGPGKKATLMRGKLIAGIVAGKTQKQSAIDAGYSEKTAASQASQILNSSKAMTEYQSALRRAGVNPDRIAKKINKHLDAKKKVSTTDGESDVEDYQTQQKAIEQAMKIDGVADKVDIAHSGGVRLITNVKE